MTGLLVAMLLGLVVLPLGVAVYRALERKPRRCWQCRRWHWSNSPNLCTRCYAINQTNAELAAEEVVALLQRNGFVAEVYRGPLQ